MRGLFMVLASTLVLLGCTSNRNRTPDDPNDGRVSPDSLVEPPGALPRPPAGKLPDELRPPR